MRESFKLTKRALFLLLMDFLNKAMKKYLFIFFKKKMSFFFFFFFHLSFIQKIFRHKLFTQKIKISRTIWVKQNINIVKAKANNNIKLKPKL